MQGICLFMQLFGMHLCVYSIFLKAGSLYKFAIALAVASIWFTVLAAAPLRRLEHKVKSRYKIPFVKYPVADLFLLFTLIIWGILTVRYLGHIKADMTTLTDAVAHRQRQYNYGVSGAFQPYADRYHGAVGTGRSGLELLAGLFMSAGVCTPSRHVLGDTACGTSCSLWSSLGKGADHTGNDPSDRRYSGNTDVLR